MKRCVCMLTVVVVLFSAARVRGFQNQTPPGQEPPPPPTKDMVTVDVELTPERYFQGVLYKRENSFLEGGDYKPYPIPLSYLPGHLVIGYNNDWDNGVLRWHHLGEVYRGALRFSLPPELFAVGADHVLEATLTFTVVNLADHDGDANPRSRPYCGWGDEFLLPITSWLAGAKEGFFFLPGFGYIQPGTWAKSLRTGDDGTVGMEPWLLVDGAPFGAFFATPATGAAGVDLLGPVKAWITVPGYNWGVALHNTEQEGMAEDRSDCVMEYSDFVLKIKYWM